MSRPPKCSAAASTAPRTCSRSRTSRAMPNASDPAAETASVTGPRPSTDREVTATRAPAEASATAIAKPMPSRAPVMRATLPASPKAPWKYSVFKADGGRRSPGVERQACEPGPGALEILLGGRAADPDGAQHDPLPADEHRSESRHQGQANEAVDRVEEGRPVGLHLLQGVALPQPYGAADRLGFGDLAADR